MSRVRHVSRWMVGIAALALIQAILPAATTGAAQADGSTAATGRCVAYANSSGMGSYCATGGAGSFATLRERFGNAAQKFQNCRYEQPPKTINKPFNPTPDEGDWWLATCLYGMDWNSYDGNPEMSIYLAYLPKTFDTTYRETDLSRFLWQQARASTQFPVPFSRPKPIPVPRVGAPAFFEFAWLDPENNKPVKQGQYSTDPEGGPFVRIDNGPLEMEARASNIKLDPHQKDMDPVTCEQENPRYDTSIAPDQPEKQASDCFITFKRSSASARDFSTIDYRKSLGDVYMIDVTVTWSVRYREDGGPWQRLGDYDMVAQQPLPVREVQANNVPPRAVIR